MSDEKSPTPVAEGNQRFPLKPSLTTDGGSRGDNVPRWEQDFLYFFIFSVFVFILFSNVFKALVNNIRRQTAPNVQVRENGSRPFELNNGDFSAEIAQDFASSNFLTGFLSGEAFGITFKTTFPASITSDPIIKNPSQCVKPILVLSPIVMCSNWVQPSVRACMHIIRTVPTIWRTLLFIRRVC